ncbi:MAG TPA: hypothetical protein VGK61_08590 [Planctomycetota bacterium]|jgi:hypothetical protein
MNKTGRRTRGDRGISLGLVILLVLVTMILSFSAVASCARHKEILAEKTRLEKAKQAEEALTETLMTAIKNGVKPTGLAPTGEPDNDWIAANMMPTKSEEEVKTRRGVIFKPGDEKDEAYREIRYGTLESLLIEMADRIALLQLRYERAKLEADLARAYAEKKTAARPEVLKDKEQFKARLQTMIKEVSDRIAAVDKAYNERKAGLTAQADKLKGEIEQEQAQFREFERRETGRIKKMRNDLEQMKQKEVLKHRVAVAHGKVLRPDTPQKSAFIDLGSRERVVPGLRFLAARIGFQGKFEYKAVLEVKKVWLDTSEVAIVRAIEGMGPVIDGDLIVNPFYNPRRPVIVAFAGHVGDRAFNLRSGENNPKPLRFSAKEAANRIKEMGSEARTSVTLDADFVLFTEVTTENTTRDSWPDYRKAVLLEIPIADAADYYEFLGG